MLNMMLTKLGPPHKPLGDVLEEGNAVVMIPTHLNMVRDDYADVIYKNAKAKFRAVVREIKELHEQGRPVLVGTISIDTSEMIARMLKKEKIPRENSSHALLFVPKRLGIFDMGAFKS